MRRRKHKRSANTLVLVTSDAPAAQLKQMRIKPWILTLLLLIVCVVLGLVIGYFVYEEKIWQAAFTANQDKISMIEQLQKENQELKDRMESDASDYQNKIISMEDEIRLLSNSLQDTLKSEEELSKQLEDLVTPTDFPLSGSAAMEEMSETDPPICVFKASEATNVVATAGGTVEAVNDDVEYGHNVWVNHGNGYVTIYRNQGDPQVKVGDSVVQGTTLFGIGKDNQILGYQMMYQGEYIDPMSMLAING